MLQKVSLLACAILVSIAKG
jgi:hypothetical protein